MSGKLLIKGLSSCFSASLQIGKNPIGDGGVETLLNVVKAHRTIKFLSLEVGSNFTESWFKHSRKYLDCEQSLFLLKNLWNK